MHLKARLFAILLILVCGAMIYYGWYRLHEEGVYSLKMAALLRSAWSVGSSC